MSWASSQSHCAKGGICYSGGVTEKWVERELGLNTGCKKQMGDKKEQLNAEKAREIKHRGKIWKNKPKLSKRIWNK